MHDKLRIGFLLYRSRSGSTFFGERLNLHPDILVTPESNIVPRLIHFYKETNIYTDNVNLTDFLYKEEKFKDWGIPKELLEKEIVNKTFTHWNEVFLIVCKVYKKWKKPNAKILIIKKGGWYYKNVNTLLKVIPEAFAIFMVRDPRAIHNSASKSTHSEGNRVLSKNSFKTAIAWNQYLDIYNRQKFERPRSIIGVKFERVLHSLEESLLEVWDFLKVSDLSDNSRDKLLSEKVETRLVTKSTKHLHNNVSKKPIVSRIDGWKQEMPFFTSLIIKTICYRRMKMMGYD